MFFCALCFSLLFSFIKGDCGFPGVPKHGSVQVNDQIAIYTCPSAMIGDAVRLCQDGAWTGAIPRCGVKYNLTHAANEGVADGIVLRAGTELTIPLDGRHFTTKIELKSHRHGAIKSDVRITALTKWNYVVLTVDANQSKSMTLGSCTGDEITRTCHLNQSVDAIRLSVVENMFQLFIHINRTTIDAFPEGCGKPEVPLNGDVNWNEQQANYWCSSGYHISCDSPQTCHLGRWSGQLPTCVPNEFQNSTGLFIASLVTLVVSFSMALALSKFICSKIPSARTANRVPPAFHGSDVLERVENEYAYVETTNRVQPSDEYNYDVPYAETAIHHSVAADGYLMPNHAL